MADGTTWSGVVTGVDMRDTHQKLTTDQQFSSKLMWAVFNKQAFYRAMGLEAFGVDAVQNLDVFGAAVFGGSKPQRMISFDKGNSMSFPINATAGSSFHTNRNGSYTPEYVAGGDQSLWAWHRLNTARTIPEMDIMDNETKTLINLKTMRFQEATNVHVRDLALGILGSSSAPDYGTDGPNALKSDIPNLISVTQSSGTVGGIALSGNTFWQNQLKQITSIGGGGDMDRPVTLRRGMLAIDNDAREFAESAQRFLMLCNQGFWQTYDRLMYADSKENGGVMYKGKAYDAAGIQHKVFNGSPMMWDTNATAPVGASASTDFCYGIDVDNFYLSLHASCAFRLFDGWEDPRVHDQYRGHQLLISTRYTPYVTSRRTHYVIYDVPQNTD